jgi:hypothetical protein
MTDPILQNKEHFDRKVQEIRNYPDISTEAKRRYLSEPYAQAKQSMTRVGRGAQGGAALHSDSGP